jgi:hypothetical protein
VHGIFADQSDRLLGEASARVVTANTVTHPSNGMDVSPLLSAALTEWQCANLRADGSSV